MKSRKNGGQSLIEALAALGIVALVILGIVKAATVSIKNANYSQGQTGAVSLAQKKISEIIAVKNNNPLAFFNSLPSYPDAVVEQFCLKTTLTDISPATLPEAKMAKIQVTVYWGENGAGSQCSGKQYFHNYHVETNVTN